MSRADDASLMRDALGHHRAGRFTEAAALYRQVLTHSPDHVDALHLLGIVIARGGNAKEAIHFIHRAIALRSDVPDFQNSLGNILLQAGRIDEAIDAFQRAIALHADYADAYNNLGNAYKKLGRFPDALAVYRQAAQIAPESAEIQNNLGVSLRLNGRLEEAVAAFETAIGLRPDYAEPYNNLGTVLRNLHRAAEAIQAYRSALKLRPNLVEAWTNLGNVQRDLGQLDEAIAAHTQAIRLRPEHANAFSNLAGALTSAGRLDEAMAALRKAVAINPQAADLHSNLLYTMHFVPGVGAGELLSAHQNWAARFADPIAPSAPVMAPPIRRRVKVGFVSPDLNLHPVARFLAPLLAEIDRTRFEIICYSDVRRPDAMTDRLRSYTDQWRDTVACNDEQLAAWIRQDEIDVLIDLTLHMADNRMLVFARRPAPVQITWLGYVGTTGMRAMQYRISDPCLDPPEKPLEYSEKTLRLPHSFWCYEASDQAGEVQVSPSKSNGYITFGCFNNFCKITGRALSLWAKLLESIPGSRIILHSGEGSHRHRVRDVFGESGVESDRVEFVPFQPLGAFFRLHDRVDICLDPFPYGGGTTTCDALWMGCPVVTLAGEQAVGRAGVSILNNVGLPELIANSPEEYLQVARQLAADFRRLEQLRIGMRQRMMASPLMDAKGFARAMEGAWIGAIEAQWKIQTELRD